ncbi:MAG: class I SAM-dependent methyltransferase [bacterium]
MNRTNIINFIINKYGCKNYLEIGVRDTRENFDLINSKNKDGVDPQPITSVNYKMTSDEFFKNHVNGKKYDVIFIDGLHTKEQVYVDVMNSINHLNDNGFIVIHDCNPPTEYHIRTYEEYIKNRGQWNGDVFLGFIKLKYELKNWNCFVIDEDFGCGIITKNKLNREFKPLSEFNNKISWEEFNENRKELLDLITYDEYIKVITPIQ